MRYVLIAILILFLEIMVATTFKEYRLIRGSVSDILATMFVFFAILSFIKIRSVYLGIMTLLFAFSIEFGQTFQFADRIGLRRGSLLSILFGNTFSYTDIACYTLGVCLSIFIVSKCIKERVVHDG